MFGTVLCVDIGTTSLKAGLVTEVGEVVFLFRKSFSDPDDRFVANQWYGVLKDCICEIKNKTNGLELFESIQGICVSGAGPTVVLENGLTFRWNEAIADVIVPELEGFSLFIPRILALKQKFLSDFEKSSYVISGPEFIIYKLTDKAVTILPEERYVQAYWDNKRLDICQVSCDKMPAFTGIGSLAGYVTDVIAEELGFTAKMPVYTGAPDFIVAMIGTNSLKEGKLCDRAGSSEGFNFCTEKHFFNTKTRTLPSVISNLWNVSALTTESGRIFVDYKKKLEALSGSKISYEDLIKIAFADKNCDAAKVIEKILLQVRESVNNLRAVVEGEGLVFPKTMTVTGGQAKNDLWMQTKANALNMTLEVCNCADSELIGDACAAWFGLGKYSSIKQAAESIVKITKRFMPEK